MKKEPTVVCRQCGMEQTRANIRCVRCHAILLSPCQGSCAKCQEVCTERKQ